MADLKWRDAINRVLAEAKEPLTADEITKRIIESNLRSSLGATPTSTVSANINTAIKDQGDQSPYIRVDKGVFALRELFSNPTPTTTAAPNAESQEQEQYKVFTSFGMYWLRERVDWVRNPKLLGKQKLESQQVNFSDQLGIYLLYDGREVIYVGRSTERPLGLRLFEHTADRLSSRWDRFSWFGLKPLDETGKLSPMPHSYSAEYIIPALEAILIEALEPRQNRRRGDDLGAAEFMQVEDPELRKKRAMAYVQRAFEDGSKQ